MSKMWLCILLMIFTFSVFSLSCFGDLMVLFDEDAKDEAGAGDFVGKFVSHDAGSTVTVTDDDAFSGKVAAFTTPAQSHNNQMPGWSFPVRENPGSGEYRYIAFAWKSDGGAGVMIQFSDNGDWGAVTDPCVGPPAPGTRRYIAGENVTGWSGICISDDVPAEWTVVERDLFADFGEFTMTGMALTPFDDGGNGDYYDSIMLGSAPVTAVEPAGKIAVTWGNIKNK
jgi:hypothetical protein